MIIEGNFLIYTLFLEVFDGRVCWENYVCVLDVVWRCACVIVQVFLDNTLFLRYLMGLVGVDDG